jgi:hypothetical protein
MSKLATPSKRKDPPKEKSPVVAPKKTAPRKRKVNPKAAVASNSITNYLNMPAAAGKGQSGKGK